MISWGTSQGHRNNLMESTLDSIYYRQEKPDLQEPPERAPAGIGVEPLLASELPDGITFFTSGLLHALQVTEDISEEDKILSNFFPHFSQEKRYIGIVLIFYLNF